MKRPMGLVLKHQICVSLILSFVLFGIAGTAWAGDKEDVAAATAEWAKVFTDDNPDPILALYDKEAVMCGELCLPLAGTTQRRFATIL